MRLDTLSVLDVFMQAGWSFHLPQCNIIKSDELFTLSIKRDHFTPSNLGLLIVSYCLPLVQINVCMRPETCHMYFNLNGSYHGQ